MKKTKCILSALFILLFSSFAIADVINVPADQPTIQDGINSAVSGDTVLVAAGTYVENINYNGKNIVVGSLFLTTLDTTYISQTVIDGNNITSVVTFESGENLTAVLVGFTITNGQGGGDYPTWWGGGINCENSSSPSLSYLTITGNSAANGGGIYCHSSSPSLSNVTIKENSASTFSGGGIYCHSSSPSFSNVTITGNSASYKGGGIYCDWNSDLTLTNVTITENSATNDGGGICCYSNMTLSNVTITENSAASGGGIYCSSYSPILSNVTITGNSAVSGGGIYCYSSSPNFSSTDRCNIYLNNVNNRESGSDIYSSPSITVIVDTFTVLNPTDFHASPIGNFTFDILNGIQNQVDADLHVSTEGDNTNSGLTPGDPLKTIQYAMSIVIVDSLNPHTIYLADGIYSPSTNGEFFPINIPDYLSLRGESEDNVILDAANIACVINFDNTDNCNITNLIITNGSGNCGGGISCSSCSPSITNVIITGNSASIGGGIYCNNSSPTITDVTITGNSASSYSGGGIYCYSSSPTLSYVTITGNSATNYGGGIYCSSSSNPSIMNVTITENSTGSGGAGIYCYSSNPSLTNVTITGNSTISGGGIFLDSSSNPSLSNVTITENSVSGSGGGIYCRFSSSPSLLNVTITGNSANSGGGINCYSSNPSLTNVAITGNSASNRGGGINLESSSPDLTKVTITENSASYSGGGIYCYNNSSPSLVNCISWNDSPQELYFNPYGEPNTITISYSDIEEGEAGIVTNTNGTVYWLEGNIDANPLFVDPANGDYHLSWANFPTPDATMSPCIDAGDPSSPYDPDGTIADMGAYYYNQADSISSPENILISVDSDSVYISWDTVPGAISYSVYSDTDPYGVFSTLEWIGSNTSWSEIIPGIKKFYYVTAISE